MIKAQSLIVLPVFFMLIFAHAALSQRTKSDVNITYDVYFKKYQLGETSALVNPKGKITAIDTSILIEKLPLLFKKVGIYGHRLQQNTSLPSLMDINEVEKSLDLILRVNTDEFRIEIELPPHLKLIQAAPLDANYLDLNTISEAKSRGWLDISGSLLLKKPWESLRGTSWRGGFAINDWHVYANGIFSTDSSTLLKSWRIEKLVWEENKSRFQFGWPNISQIISGQLVGSSIFGAAISNSFTSISESAILKELPGGVVQLNENSLVEIFRNGSLIHSLELNAGRYNVRDLEIDPTLNTIDIRITTESGRLETTTINRFAMPIQAKKKHFNTRYTLACRQITTGTLFLVGQLIKVWDRAGLSDCIITG